MRNRAEGEGLSPAVMSLEEIEAAFDDVIARVEAGETLVIERDGRPVVRLQPPSPPKQ